MNSTEQSAIEGKPYPGFVQAIWLLLFSLILLMLIAIPSSLFVRVLHWDSYVVGMLRMLIATGMVLWYGFRKTRASFAVIFPFRPFPVALLLPMLLTVIGASIVVSEIDNIVRIFLPVPPEMVEEFIKLAGVGDQVIIAVVFTILAAPVIEEMLFRGLILKGFAGRYPINKAIVLSALLFGIWHLNPWQFFGAMVYGIFLAWWFINTGSLIPCIIGHAVNNGLPLLLVRIIGLQVPGYTGGLTAIQLQPVWFDLLGVLLFAAGVFLSMSIFKRRNSVA